MAKMKSDVLQLYYHKHGVSFRDKLIRDSSKAAAKIAGWRAGLVNAVLKTGLFRLILEKQAGFDRRRTLPEFASEPFYKWFKKNANGVNKGSKQVVLFADTYLNFHETEVGISAYELLRSCGYEVILANVGCCQRPKISHGFLEDAKEEGLKTAMNLKPYFEQGLMVVGCEPSCVSALSDDLPDLLDHQELAAQLSSGVVMIDVFLAEEMDAGNIDVDFESTVGDVVLHGHCHQKALYGTNSMKAIYNKTGNQVEEIPSGCCGMAGSFGYEKEHYGLSEKIGEAELFPAIKKLNSDKTVVACGFSCRHQIEHFTGIQSRHWVQTVRAKQKKKKTKICHK